jgi:hypothetical protein
LFSLHPDSSISAHVSHKSVKDATLEVKASSVFTSTPMPPALGGAVPPAIEVVTPFVVGAYLPAPPVALEMAKVLALNAAPFEPQPSTTATGEAWAADVLVPKASSPMEVVTLLLPPSPVTPFF